MKSKTAIAALAATLAMCGSANAIIVDTLNPIDVLFTIPPAYQPTVQCCGLQTLNLSVHFDASDPLSPGDSIGFQWFDANHNILNTPSPAFAPKDDITAIVFSTSFTPLLTTPTFSVEISAASGSFDVVSAVSTFFAPDGDQYVMVGSIGTPTPVPSPIVGAGLPGLLGMLGFGGWQWRRRQRQKIA
jgi:hypothetical protein